MATIKKVQNNGDTVTWKFRVYNSSDIPCSGVEAELTIPDGVTLTGPLVSNSTYIDVPVGSFNPTTKIWFIGLMEAKSYTEYVNLEFTVDDVTKVDPFDDSFSVTSSVSSRCTESDTTNNDLELKIQVAEECKVINLSVGGE